MNSQLIIYPEFDERIERDFLYTVSVTQGTRTESVPVYNHTEDSRVNRNPVDDRRADEFRRFSTFAFEGEGVRVDIRVNRDFCNYSVMPSAKAFKHEFSDGVISVYLQKPDYFLIRLDGKDYTILSVFADAPEAYDLQNEKNLLVVDRWHEVNGGILKLTEPDTTVYIPAGSVLNARVEVLADNCKILGRGAIVDPVGDIYRYSAADFKMGVVLLVRNASNTLIDGIHMLDAKAFNVEFIGIWQESWAMNNRIKNAKILSTQMSTDGITCCYYSKDSYAEHCFIYCGDNALVYEEYAHYKDITVGTTCNAVFPQTDVVDSSVEDVYIFRADEGIINCEYCGENGITKIENHTMKNIYASDITYTPYFMFVEVPTVNPVVSTLGGLTVENVWIPSLKDTRTKVFLNNVSGGDYEISLKNLSIGGQLIEAINAETTGGQFNPAGHTFTYSYEDGFNWDIVPEQKEVNYKNGVNAFVGKYQIYFEYPIIMDGENILLPYEQLKAELRTACVAKTEQVDGKSYVRLDEVVASKMARSVSVDGNDVVFSPNESFDELLLPDSGVVSKLTEYICYASHLVTFQENGETVYRIINTHRHSEVGIFRLLGEEIKKYGEGEYCLSFDARCEKGGTLRAAIDLSESVAAESRFPSVAEWHSCRFDVSVRREYLDEPKIAMIITVGGNATIDCFDVKNISLKKIK